MRLGRLLRHFVSALAFTGAMAAVLTAVLPATVLAAHWTEVPFPSEYSVGEVVQDSRGDIWVAVTSAGGEPSILVLRTGAGRWEVQTDGIEWEMNHTLHGGLVTIGEKLFLGTLQGCYARSLDDAGWHLVGLRDGSTPIRAEGLLVWDELVWTVAENGVLQIDPQTEQWQYANGGLPSSNDRGWDLTAPRGTDQYLYLGTTTTRYLDRGDFDLSAVGVYRLKKGSDMWEDTGLSVEPLPDERQIPEGQDLSEWGVCHVRTTAGYVLCSVGALWDVAKLRTPRLFLYDERDATWAPVGLPTSAVGLPVSATNAGETTPSVTEFVDVLYAAEGWNGEFYLPVGHTAKTADFTVFDPVKREWRPDVTMPAVSWSTWHGMELVGPPFDETWVHVDTVRSVAGELLVGAVYDTEPAGPPPAESGFISSVPLPTEISKDPEVIGTNFVLALIFAVIFGFTSTLFNNTLKSKNAEIVTAMGPVTHRMKAWARMGGALLRRLGRRLKAMVSQPAWLQKLTSSLPHPSRKRRHPVAIVLITGLIYAFLDPGFGFSANGLMVFVSLAVSVAVVTYSYEGLQALASSRGYRVPAGLKLFPAAIAVAIICVIVSRASGFIPGYLYGFVGGLAFLGAVEPDDRKKGRLVLLAAVCLLLVSLAAWFLAVPLTDAVDAGSSWLKVAQGICVATFVAGLEGLLFGLVPLSFMDGWTLFRWNRWVWGAVFGVVVFLFWHVLLNKNSKYGAAFQETSAKLVIGLLAFWTVVTVGTYLYFRKPWRKPSAAPAAVPVAGPAAIPVTGLTTATAGGPAANSAAGPSTAVAVVSAATAAEGLSLAAWLQGAGRTSVDRSTETREAAPDDRRLAPSVQAVGCSDLERERAGHAPTLENEDSKALQQGLGRFDSERQ